MLSLLKGCLTLETKTMKPPIKPQFSNKFGFNKRIEASNQPKAKFVLNNSNKFAASRSFNPINSTSKQVAVAPSFNNVECVDCKFCL